ncbi:uncharacterized protein LOC103712237 isoform X2 [Phoenix dactylifera]|uniref:Uncharacterized protein LOC103712237 isoform X2 n=1 Tax=Phoenix dactylifera TaxID=42345 RepID=A0A8B8ZBX0_PHODC|nr:uncharacterized protein LOC103712237 isoform X2 [Phoenix dactylifera]XP_038970793.1 uncharacterized protein LOC103712237 isoform X2 [Phoenix dactylifera]
MEILKRKLCFPISSFCCVILGVNLWMQKTVNLLLMFIGLKFSQASNARRDRINGRIKTLQKLVPNSSKNDKVPILDEAIEYLNVQHATNDDDHEHAAASDVYDGSTGHREDGPELSWKAWAHWNNSNHPILCPSPSCRETFGSLNQQNGMIHCHCMG